MPNQVKKNQIRSEFKMKPLQICGLNEYFHMGKLQIIAVIMVIFNNIQINVNLKKAYNELQ